MSRPTRPDAIRWISAVVLGLLMIVMGWWFGDIGDWQFNIISEAGIFAMVLGLILLVDGVRRAF